MAPNTIASKSISESHLKLTLSVNVASILHSPDCLHTWICASLPNTLVSSQNMTHVHCLNCQGSILCAYLQNWDVVSFLLCTHYSAVQFGKKDISICMVYFMIGGMLEKYPTLLFFYENLVDFNEAHLHEATLNLHRHAWIFSCIFWLQEAFEWGSV